MHCDLHDISCGGRLDLGVGIRYMHAMDTDGTSRDADDRAERLAEALRANLRKRKAQGRARKDPGVSPQQDDRPAEVDERD